MATLATLRTQVLANLDRAGAPSAENTYVTSWINQAIREVICRRHNWASMEAVSNEVSTVAGTQAYNFPSANTKDVKEVLFKGAGSGDDFAPIDEITDRQARWSFLETTEEGVPSRWARFARTVLLRPIPDANSYTLKYITWEYPAALSGDSDANDWTNSYTRLVECWATAFGYEFYLSSAQAVAKRQIAEAELAEEIRQAKLIEGPSAPRATPSLAAGIRRSGMRGLWRGGLSRNGWTG